MLTEKIKMILGVTLIVIGLIYEINVYYELATEDQTALTSTSDYAQHSWGIRIKTQGTREMLPINSYHHFLFGMSMIAGAILLSNVKVNNIIKS